MGGRKEKKVPQLEGQIHLEHRDHRDRPVTRLDSDAGELELNGHDDRDACRIGWVTCIDRQLLRCQPELRLVARVGLLRNYLSNLR